MAVNYGQTFSASTTWSIPASTHGLGHNHLRVQCFSAATPRQRIQGQLSVDSSGNVTVSWLQAQAGLVVISGYQPAPGLQGNQAWPVTISAGGSIIITGAQHGYGTDHLLLDLYDNGTPRVWYPLAACSIHPTSFDVTISSLQALTGWLVICAYGDSGTTNSATSISVGAGGTVTVLGTTHNRQTANLGVQAYDTSGAEILPGAVTVHPTTFTVTAQFLQAQTGTLILQGSQHATFLTASVASASATQAAALATARHLTATVVASSSALAPAMGAGRHFIASVTAASVVPTASPGLNRHLSAFVTGASATTAAGTTGAKHLSANVTGLVDLPLVAAGMGSFRFVLAKPTASSATPSATVQSTRLLVARVSPQSRTPSASSATTRPVSARLSASSATALVTPTYSRGFQATLTAASTTAPALSSLRRPLHATLAAASTTSLPHALVLRVLAAFVAAESLTSQPLQATLRALTNALHGIALTPAVALPPVHALRALVQARIVTPRSALQTDHELFAALIGSSWTSDAALPTGYFIARLASLSVTGAAHIQMDVGKGQPHRVEYPTEVHIVAPDGRVLRIIRKVPVPQVRVYNRIPVFK